MSPPSLAQKADVMERGTEEDKKGNKCNTNKIKPFTKLDFFSKYVLLFCFYDLSRVHSMGKNTEMGENIQKCKSYTLIHI